MGLAMRRSAILLSLSACAALSACGGDPAPQEPIVNEVDPYIARALNDPLMVDPDLAHRNEANAAITIGYDHALPSFKGSEEAASRARETARLELLEDGPISDLPFAQTDGGPASLAGQFGVSAVLATIGVPQECQSNIRGDFAYAASMPDVTRIMPHGMVRVAAAVEEPGCTLHLARYQTPASIEDVAQYHYNRIRRAGFEPSFFESPETSLIAHRRGTHVQVFARKSTGNLTSVDVITWSRR
jgi:hypothetical protein